MRRSSRLLLIGLSLGLAYVMRMQPFVGGMLLVSVGLLIYGHFRYGAVPAAFRAARNGRLGAAQAALEESASDWLAPAMVAYAEWVRAVLAEADGRLLAAADHMERADVDALRRNDRAVLRATRAAVMARLNDRAGAEEALEAARELQPTGKAAAIVARVSKDLAAL
ncbi:MAG: hypothetical protein AAF411_05720 [Myxococcota bacterium]